MKQYVAVEARFDEGGGVRPLCVIWEDGRRFPVDRVMDVRRAASLKAGRDRPALPLPDRRAGTQPVLRGPAVVCRNAGAAHG